MGEIDDSINKKTSILLSRNRPAALVVGAAGFLGSHLVDKLLEKNIQVVGVDNLDAGKKDHLRKAIESKDFHLILESAEKLAFDLERVDYIFITSSAGWNLDKVLDLFTEKKGRLLFVSSIDLYDKEYNLSELKWFEESESKIAKKAAEFNLNARVLRLGPVFGPRMHFRIRDPLIRLIAEALTDDLQKDVSLEFSSRALYVNDAVDLIIRTIFSGATSQKIFDGVSPEPVKVAEIKQVLLDPVWYENRSFIFSGLPPWPTPNLNKTIKFLNWQPKIKLLKNLRETLSYFRDNEIQVPRVEEKRPKKEEPKEEIKLDESKKKDLELFKQSGISGKDIKQKKGNGGSKFFSFSKVYLLMVLSLVGFGLVWPGLVLGWGAVTFHYQLNEGFRNLQKGEFEKSLENISNAEKGVEAVNSIFESLEPLNRAGIFTQQYEQGRQLIILSDLSAASAKSAVTGMQMLLQGLKAVTGELTESPAAYFKSAQVELNSASVDLARADSILKGDDFDKNLPSVATGKIKNLGEKLKNYTSLVDKARALSFLLPSLVAMEGNKNYLILLQNNMELRPTGGFIGSFAKVSFEGGKLKKLDVNDIYAIDGQLPIHVEPPKEIKEDLDQKDWYLRDSNWEPDFPTSARQAEWFYTKETGEKVEGTFALDVSAMEMLLSAIGPLYLPDYKEKITSENLFEKAVSHAEMSFFPGSQAKKSFLTALTNEVFNKIFFSPQNNWPGIISEMGRALDEKHISFYLDDPKLFSYVDSQGWTHVLPRATKENQNQDFLSLVEANLGANKANFYVDRNYNLETVVGKDGEVKHRMRISYVNRSPSDTFPAGKYKNRLRIYLPFGSKITKLLWGESEKTAEVLSFVDYGRSGYSILLELAPKEQKNLVLDYTVPVKLEFVSGKASYRLDIIKQAGMLKDPLQWTITYPISYQLVSSQAKQVGPQEQVISTDLSKDRSFEVEFRK